ncbi:MULTISPECIES: ABC transporter permease [Mesorhizobium]|uniref:ABC transporter permease n=1 Tax=Mesorhizobium TaxID=68287 RepID=UPI003337C613
MDLALIQAALPLLWKGAETTLIIGFFGMVIGLPLGIALALARLSAIRWVVAVSSLYSAVFRGTPLLVQIFILYYGLGQLSAFRHTPILWWLIGNSLHCAILAVVLNTIAYTSEIFRGGFLAVPRGMIEAAQASGMSPWVTLHRIHFPLALRQALPAYANEVAILIKESSLASTITVLEITGYAKRLMSETFAIIEIFALASMFYLTINLIALSLASWLERRLATPDSSARKK